MFDEFSWTQFEEIVIDDRCFEQDVAKQNIRLFRSTFPSQLFSFNGDVSCNLDHAI